MLNKVWNYKIRGIPGAITLLSKVIIDRIVNKTNHLLISGNLKEVEKGNIIYKGLNYRYPKNIRVGKDCIINKDVSFGSELAGSFLEIGNNVSIAKNVKLDFTGGIKIEDNVTISENVKIYTHDHGFDPRSTPVKNGIVIKENVWIGVDAIILQNVNVIDKNSIIAAGSVVTKDIPANTIYGGNPAKKLKQVPNTN